MASDGLARLAKKGKCRICQRRRDTTTGVKAVGEVHHGFATTGHIWECNDEADCEMTAIKKLKNPCLRKSDKAAIESALNAGRFQEYKIIS